MRDLQLISKDKGMSVKQLPFFMKEEFKKELVQADKLHGKIYTAFQTGDSKALRAATRLFLNSNAAKVVAVARVNAGRNKDNRLSPKNVRKIARGLSPWRGSDEPATVIFKQKADNENEFRPIVDFGIKNQSLQLLVHAALDSACDLNPHQYFTRGGTHGAVSEVMDNLSAGYRWCCEVDIAKCFQSFDGGKLPGCLPLPEAVTRKVVSSQYYNLIPGNFKEELGEDAFSNPEVVKYHTLAAEIVSARQGIPQGSSVSPLVSEILLAPVIDQLPHKGRIVAYADNILLQAQSENEAVDMVSLLRRALKKHPAGPLMPSRITSFKPQEHIRFLGYLIKKKEGGYKAVPRPDRFKEFKKRINRKIDYIENPTTTLAQKKEGIESLTKYVKSWTAAYPLWEDRKQVRAKYLDRIKQIAP